MILIKHHIKPFIFVIGFICAFYIQLFAQDTIAHFRLNAGASNYYYHTEYSSDLSQYPTPEIEVLYCIQSFKKLSVFTGIHYIYSYSYDDLGRSEWRRMAHELEIPLFMEQSIGKFISVKGGAAIGYLIKGKEEYRSNLTAHPNWKDVTYLTDYDESSRFSVVFYIDPKLKYDFDAWNTLSIGPTMRFYIKDNWMKNTRNETMIGISLQYSFRF